MPGIALLISGAFVSVGSSSGAVAAARATAFDARWDPILDRLSDAIAGRPTGG